MGPVNEEYKGFKIYQTGKAPVYGGDGSWKTYLLVRRSGAATAEHRFHYSLGNGDSKRKALADAKKWIDDKVRGVVIPEAIVVGTSPGKKRFKGTMALPAEKITDAVLVDDAKPPALDMRKLEALDFGQEPDTEGKLKWKDNLDTFNKGKTPPRKAPKGARSAPKSARAPSLPEDDY